MNVLKAHLRQSVETMLSRGVSQREIARVLGVGPKTTRRIARELTKTPRMATDAEVSDEAKSRGVATGDLSSSAQNGPGWPPVHPVSLSACEAHREWTEEQVRLGRNAMSIFRELVDRYGFGNQYNSVKRFVAGLKQKAPERFDVLEFAPGEEAQVDYP